MVKPKAGAPKAPPKGPSKDKKIALVPTSQDYLRQLRAMKGVEADEYAMFSDELAGANPTVHEWLPTGSLAIDRLLDGGWPIGRIVEVAAWEGVGKTTLLDQSLAQVQRMGGIGALIDSERARDERYTQALGVNLDDLLTAKGRTIEDAWSAIDRIIAVHAANTAELRKRKKEPPPMLIVWDSLGGTPSRGELEGGAGDSHVAEAARNTKLNLRRLTAQIADLRVCLVIANHFYKTIGPFATLETYGGTGLKYYPSVRLFLSRTGSLKVADRVVGHSIEVKLKKTRVSKPRPPAEIGLIYGAGVHNSYTLFEWGKTCPGHRWIKQAGAWCWLMLPGNPKDEGIAFQHTFMGLGQLLHEHADIYEQMATAYLQEGRDAKPEAG